MVGILAIQLTIAVGLLLGLAGAFEGAYRRGRRDGRSGEAPSSGQVGAIQGALLSLLGLLLAFSFSAAASRFLERQDLIVAEANTIRTAYLRADLLDELHASRVRQELAGYVRHRLEASARLGRGGAGPEAEGQVAQFHARLWEAASAGVLAKPGAMVAVLNPVNEVINLHATRVAARRKHLPVPVLSLLIACSLVAMGVIGYGSGLAGRRCLVMTGSLALVIAVALWTTIDLDHPRLGGIRVSDAPLQQLNLGGAP